jgi:hypothetical protein
VSGLHVVVAALPLEDIQKDEHAEHGQQRNIQNHYNLLTK